MRKTAPSSPSRSPALPTAAPTTCGSTGDGNPTSAPSPRTSSFSSRSHLPCPVGQLCDSIDWQEGHDRGVADAVAVVGGRARAASKLSPQAKRKVVTGLASLLPLAS
uniref:Uncharacterized protein n=1 Tax=Zea mays TaxID=4577 RepID=A0A804UFJ4_MAIZE